MVFENPHSKKYKKGDGFLTDLFNTSTKLIKDNKDSLLSIVSESSKLKDNISKNIDLNKKIAKLDAESRAKLYEEKKKQTEKKLEEEKKQQTEKPVNVKKEIVKDIITKKKGRGFYDIH